MDIRRAVVILITVVMLMSTAPGLADGKASVFMPSWLADRARANVARFPWAAEIRDGLVERARPWVEMSDEDLWNLMFGSTITRSWMVWSDGHCPACKEGVPMYNWEMAPLQRPWKVRCPHCKTLFPTNDFGAFYRSGLDEKGVFDPKRADRSLLFNQEHSDPNDPLHRFGVDDGEGYVEGDKRWRFIGAYLIYGQWKQGILDGIRALADAYTVTGDQRYAHKAAVLLDRVADLYPTFDFKTQGLVYERALGSNGYVSVWHDACEEARELALGYDQVVEGIADDPALVEFLSAKAKQYGLENPKASCADIRRNIEERILSDTVTNAHKIASNYPRTPIALATIHAVLGWPENREQVLGIITGFLQNATAVDGVTGEKGLANYSAFGLQSVALFLAGWEQASPGFLAEILQRQPRLHDMYRFHIDTWCFGEYYPLSGDSGWFARRIDQYQGVIFQRPRRDIGYSHKPPPLAPSMFTFMWRLYEMTGDAAFVQALHIANDSTVEGLPHDLFADNPEQMQRQVGQVISREGGIPRQVSVNKQQWRIALLKSGSGPNSRAVWLDYDSGGGHGHLDGMNLGLFARGLDLMPDFGYPPVQFGGWGSPRAAWYRMTAAHNTVVVDGRNQAEAGGRTTLWADGEILRAIRASCPEMVGGRQYERTVASIDLSPESFYVLDVFRVVGGKDHAKFVGSHFGTATAAGLDLRDPVELGGGAQVRKLVADPSPQPGWHVDWQVDDRYGLLPSGQRLGLRYTDLTPGALAAVGEAWVTVGGYDTNDQTWVPRVMVRRTDTGEGPLASTFVSVIEPHPGEPQLASIRRLTLAGADGQSLGENHVALELESATGVRDVVIALDAEDPLGLTPGWKRGEQVLLPELGIATDAELALVRLDASGQVIHVALCKGSVMRIGAVEWQAGAAQEFVEGHFPPK